jgi:predicted NACHT family NTPase
MPKSKGNSPKRRSLPTTEKLRVFVSSKMAELRDVREIVSKALDERGIDAWVYENNAGARPENVQSTSLDEVELADVFVGLFWQDFGEVTAMEYRHARSLCKPCFVYIRDKDKQREKRLEEFLTAEIYDLNKGVAYEFFASAIALGKQIADDVMAWLVRKHREMTAQIESARVSQDEVARLKVEVARLQSVSRESLPVGTAIDYLAQQMKGWFETLGYSFENYQFRNEYSLEWIINIPKKRRGYDRIAVLIIEGEVEIAHIARLREINYKHGTDEAWVVTTRRVSQAARDEVRKRENNDLLCYTFDELLDQDADFSAYLDWLESEVKRRKIDEMYVPLACVKEEFDRSSKSKVGVSRYDARNGWIDGYIDRWLDDPSKEHISVLGEFGTGKTWFVFHYAWTALQKYQDAKKRGIERPRVPLIIPLRDYAKAVTVQSLFSEFFFRKHEIPLPGYSAFEQLNRMGKLLLIFDGFDEMADRVDRQKMIDNFWTLAQVVAPGAKAILTCRTEHFPEATEGRALLGAELRASTAALTGRPPQFEVLELEKFDDTQIHQVLSLRANATAVEMVMGNAQLLDLARRPVMTELILEALPDIEAGKPVDLSRVYLYAVKRKMERDIKADRTFTSLADKLYFMCELSWEMLSTEQMSFNYRLFPERLSRLFGPVVKEQKDMDHWRYDMMGQTMLIRNADGDYTPAHRSLLEFFVAYKFAAEIGVLARDFTELARTQSYLKATPPQEYSWTSYFRRDIDANGVIQTIPPLEEFLPERLDRLKETFGKEPLSVAILELLKNMLGPSIEAVEQRLLPVLNETRQKSIDDTAAVGGNIATLLVRCNPLIFKGRDLSHTNLNNASFYNADMTGTILRDTNLQKASFNNTTLDDADFQAADLTETRFDEMGAVHSIAFSNDGSKLASGGTDNNVHVWDVRTGEELLTFRGHRGPVTSVCWGKNDQLIASGSADQSVILWNSLNGDIFRKAENIFPNWVTGVTFSSTSDEIAIVGGMGTGGVSVWNLGTSKEPHWLYQYPAQTNRVCYSPDGTLLASSVWDRGYVSKQMKVQVKNALVIDVNSGEPSIIMSNFQEGTWGIAFSPDGKRLFLGDFNGDIFIYDLNLKKLSSRIFQKHPPDKGKIDKRVHGIAINHKYNFVAAYSGAKISFWSLNNLALIFQLGVFSASEFIEERLTPGGRGDITFDPTGTLLVGGFEDKSIRFWDVRPYIASTGQEEFDIAGYGHMNFPESVKETVPQVNWWQNAKLNVPEGMLPNPHFGRCIRVIEQKFSCKGLRIAGARGLDEKLSSDQKVFIEKGVDTLGKWLVARGAISR